MKRMKPRVISVNISEKKGIRKHQVPCILLKASYGAEGDAHAGTWHRQVSLLALESIEKIRMKGVDVGPGDFAENVTTQGIDLASLPIGTRLRIGETVLEVTQIGKECHNGCEILEAVGDCVMPREGIFARVLKGGEIRSGNVILREKAKEQDESRDPHCE